MDSKVNGVISCWQELLRESQAAFNRKASRLRAAVGVLLCSIGSLRKTAFNSGSPNSGKIQETSKYSEERNQNGEGPPDCAPWIMIKETRVSRSRRGDLGHVE